jgi:hypothetical protein
MKFTVLPVLVAFLIGLACMPGLNIYQICAWNCGTVKTEPWRSKLSALAGVPRMVALFTRCRTWLAELTDVPLFASQIGAVGNIRRREAGHARRSHAGDGLPGVQRDGPPRPRRQHPAERHRPHVIAADRRSRMR